MAASTAVSTAASTAAVAAPKPAGFVRRLFRDKPVGAIAGLVFLGSLNKRTRTHKASPQLGPRH